MILKERIKALRSKCHISQQELSRIIGTSKSTIGLYETGETLPNAENIKKLAEYFGVSSDYLLGLSDVPTTDTTIQAICNRTGLSDDFVSWLSSHKDYAPQIEKLSRLMIDNGFIGGDNSEQE